MKKLSFLFLALSIFFASCSGLLEVSGKTDLSVSGEMFLARVAEDDGDAVYTMSVALEYTDNSGDEVIKQDAKGTLEELKGKTFKFSSLETGRTVILSCNVYKDDKLIWTGSSDEITVKSGRTEVVLKMTEVKQDDEATNPDEDEKKTEVTLTFVLDDGTEYKVLTGFAGDNLTAPDNPEKEGYEFAGWADADGNAVELPEVFPEKSKTYTATWKEILVESVTLDKTTAKIIGRYKEETLVATVTPQNALKKTVTWTTSNKDVATVDENGVVTTLSEGEATITATAGGKSATCAVKVVETFTQAEFRELLPNYKENTEDFEIPEGYTKIIGTETESVFAGWKAIEEIDYQGQGHDFSTRVIIPSSVSYIDEYAFYGCGRISYEFADTVGWMYYSLEDENENRYLEKYMFSEPWFIRERMTNRKGYMQKKTAIDVDFPFAGNSFKIGSYNSDVKIGETVSFHLEDIYDTYQWYIDGVPVEGATDSYFYWDTTGYTSGNYCIMCIVDGSTSDTYNIGIGMDTTI